MQIIVNDKILTAKLGEILKDVLDREGFGFRRNCGGKGKCGFCRVKYLSSTPELIKDEVKFLDEESAFRLACLHKVEEDCQIDIPIEEETVIDKSVVDLGIRISGEGFILAVDLGTTTAALYLVDLAQGLIAGQRTFLNPQSIMGADVMSRLEYSLNPDGLAKLCEIINQSLAEEIFGLCRDCGVESEKVGKVMIAGNTAMTHFLLGISAEELAKAPYKSRLQGKGFTQMDRALIGGKAVAKIEAVPVIDGFIGGDITAGIIAAGLDISQGNCLMIDFGTNGEIVLSCGGKLSAASTAAGPAFEGVGMQSGMPGKAGAVESITEDGYPVTIGGREAAGICGSGYISVIAYLLKRGKLLRSGLLENDEQGLRQWKLPGTGKQKIFLTQEDIRNFQLAKGAIGAGAELLLMRAGLSAAGLDEIIITGSFGNRIDVESAIAVGIIPMVETGKVRFIDNAAGRGVIMCGCDESLRSRMERIQKVCAVINLADQENFENLFIGHLNF